MNRYDWLLLAFRAIFDRATIAEVQRIVESLERNPQAGAVKRTFVEDAILPSLRRGSVYLLRALIEVALAKLRERA